MVDTVVDLTQERDRLLTDRDVLTAERDSLKLNLEKTVTALRAAHEELTSRETTPRENTSFLIVLFKLDFLM